MKDKCHLTFEPLLNEAFLIYHCGHQVHTKAAILEEISICRDPARKVRLEDVKQERGPRTRMAHESIILTQQIARFWSVDFGPILVRGTLKSRSKKWTSSSQVSKEMKRSELI